MNLSLDNLNTLKDVAWAIQAFQGEFKLIIVRCDDARLRFQAVMPLRTRVKNMGLYVMPPETTSLLEGIRDCMTAETTSVLVTLLEDAENLEELLSYTNRTRDQFRSACPFPVVLWLTSEGLKQLKRSAPDFESWGTTIHLEVDS